MSLISNPFMDLVERHLEEGLGQMVHVMKTLLYSRAPTLFDRLDFERDDAFLEPLLFAHFNTKTPHSGLDQILFGYIAADHKPTEIDVASDGDGVVYLPKVGHLLTARSGSLLTLTSRPADAPYQLHDGEADVAFTRDPLTFVEGTSVEVCRHVCPLLARFYRGADGARGDPDSATVACRHLWHLNEAFDLMRSCHPRAFAAIVKVTRKIVVFDNPALNSFASMSAHGVAFSSARSDDDEIFFLEDLAHQCGHILCNAATFQRRRYFRIDPDTPLAELTGEAGEARSVYVTFHGVFTEALMSQCLSALYGRGGLVGRQKHELAGRLAFILGRFELDLASLRDGTIFSADGLAFLDRFEEVYREIRTLRADLIARCDLSNQAYNFSYPRFLELNRMPQHSRPVEAAP